MKQNWMERKLEFWLIEILFRFLDFPIKLPTPCGIGVWYMLSCSRGSGFDSRLGLVCGWPELSVRGSGTPAKSGGVAIMIIIFDRKGGLPRLRTNGAPIPTIWIKSNPRICEVLQFFSVLGLTSEFLTIFQIVRTIDWSYSNETGHKIKTGSPAPSAIPTRENNPRRWSRADIILERSLYFD